MLEFWIISVIITLVSNYSLNKMVYNKLEDMGYIVKSKKTTKSKTIINLILNLIPNINLLIALLNAIIITISLNNEKVFDIITEEIRHTPDNVIFQFKKNYIDKKTLDENFILDGANNETKKEELSKFNDYKRFVNKNNKSHFSFFEDSPYFEEKDYKKAKAQLLAKSFLEEIESCKELTKEEKTKYLKRLRKVYLDELNNKNIEMPITKVLK